MTNGYDLTVLSKIHYIWTLVSFVLNFNAHCDLVQGGRVIYFVCVKIDNKRSNYAKKNIFLKFVHTQSCSRVTVTRVTITRVTVFVTYSLLVLLE